MEKSVHNAWKQFNEYDLIIVYVRLKDKIGGTDDKPRLGIQKATSGILAAFKYVEEKV